MACTIAVARRGQQPGGVHDLTAARTHTIIDTMASRRNAKRS